MLHRKLYTTLFQARLVIVTKTLSKKLAKSKISKKLRDLKDVYDNKLIKILLELRKKNYIIKF